jgi:hypothetical protein
VLLSVGIARKLIEARLAVTSNVSTTKLFRAMLSLGIVTYYSLSVAVSWVVVGLNLFGKQA